MGGEHLNWSCDSIEEIPVEEYGSVVTPRVTNSIYRIKNLKVSGTSDAPTKRISGKRFIASYNIHYWHFLHDDLAQFEAVKKHVPDVSIVFVDAWNIFSTDKDPEAGFTDRVDGQFVYMKDLCPIYRVEDDYFNWNTQNLIFDEVYLILNVNQHVPSEFFISNGIVPPWHGDEGGEVWHAYNINWEVRDIYMFEGLRILREKFLPRLTKNESLPKKLFISRKDVNRRLNEYKELDPIGYETRISERLFDDDVIENIFKELGYEPIQLENYGFFEQMQMFYNCTHVAGTVGSGFAGMLVTDPGATLYEIHVKPAYWFTYEYICVTFGHSWKLVDLRYPPRLGTTEGVLDSSLFKNTTLNSL